MMRAFKASIFSVQAACHCHLRIAQSSLNNPLLQWRLLRVPLFCKCYVKNQQGTARKWLDLDVMGAGGFNVQLGGILEFQSLSGGCTRFQSR
jgi:hypothetical protein